MLFQKGGWYGWKPASSSNLSIRAFRVCFLNTIRQTRLYRSIRGSSISFNSILPPFKLSRAVIITPQKPAEIRAARLGVFRRHSTSKRQHAARGGRRERQESSQTRSRISTSKYDKRQPRLRNHAASARADDGARHDYRELHGRCDFRAPLSGSGPAPRRDSSADEGLGFRV